MAPCPKATTWKRSNPGSRRRKHWQHNHVNAKQLFDEGRVKEAQKVLTDYLREHPSDVAQRTFLFELLCFSGDFDRAEKQLGVLGQGDEQTQMGAVLYYAALHAEKTRHQVFEKQEFSKDPATSPTGKLNGRPFQSLRDADPDLGARLEVFAAGSISGFPSNTSLRCK